MDGDNLARRRQVPWRRLAWAAGIGVAVLVVLAAVAQLAGMIPRWQNPFAVRETDRSQPVLVRKIQDLHRYEAATGNFQVVIDLEHDTRFIPNSILGERTLFIAAGSVDGYVDFSGIGKGAIRTSEERHAVTVLLPHAQLEKVNLNHKRSYVYAEQRGVLNRVGDFLKRDPNRERKLYLFADRKIQKAARHSRLAHRAEQNTRAMLVGMLGSLGYSRVTVRFGEPGS